ncbi:5396_t:CDS:1, partial [Gigaspora margarita]
LHPTPLQKGSFLVHSFGISLQPLALRAYCSFSGSKGTAACLLKQLVVNLFAILNVTAEFLSF